MQVSATTTFQVIFTTFSCQFGRYCYKQLPSGAVQAGDRFQIKIDEIVKELPNVCGIADDISVAKYKNYSRDHNNTLLTVL